MDFGVEIRNTSHDLLVASLSGSEKNCGIWLLKSGVNAERSGMPGAFQNHFLQEVFPGPLTGFFLKI